MDVRIAVVESMPFAENSYIVWLPGRTDAIVIDPGFEPDAVLDALRAEGLTAAIILNTHVHVDHIAGNDALKAAFPEAPLVIGAGDAAMLTDPMLNLSGLAGAAITSPRADRTREACASHRMPPSQGPEGAGCSAGCGTAQTPPPRRGSLS